MAPGRIVLDAHGRLSVPEEPTLPVAVGDGAGAETWKLVKPLAERAAAKVSYGRKKPHFLEVPAGERGARELNDRLPPSTVNAFRLYRVGLDGGQKRLAADDGKSISRELRGLLDLHVGLVELVRPAGAKLAIAIDQGESSTPVVELPAGSARSLRLVERLEAEFPSVADQLRFGAIERVDRQHAALGEVAPGVVEAAVMLRPSSRLGTERFVHAAVQLAKAHGFSRATVVEESELTPALAEARRIARTLVVAAFPEKERPTFAEARLASFPARVEREDFGLVCAAERDARLLVSAMAPAFGGVSTAALGQYNLDSGHALFSPLSPDFSAPQPLAMLRAIRLLYTHLGWKEAAALLGKATEEALAHAGGADAPAALVAAIGAHLSA